MVSDVFNNRTAGDSRGCEGKLGEPVHVLLKEM